MNFFNAGVVESQGKLLRFRFKVAQVVESALIVGTQFSADGVNWWETNTCQVQIPWPPKPDKGQSEGRH